jgi:hypothetical protein
MPKYLGGFGTNYTWNFQTIFFSKSNVLWRKMNNHLEYSIQLTSFKLSLNVKFT